MPRWPALDYGATERTHRAQQYTETNNIIVRQRTNEFMEIRTFDIENYFNVTRSRGQDERKWHRLVFGREVTIEDIRQTTNTDRAARMEFRRQKSIGHQILIPQKGRRLHNKIQCVIMPGYIAEESSEEFPTVVGCSCMDYLFQGPGLDAVVQDPFTYKPYFRLFDGDAAQLGCKHIIAYDLAKGDASKFQSVI